MKLSFETNIFELKLQEKYFNLKIGTKNGKN